MTPRSVTTNFISPTPARCHERVKERIEKEPDFRYKVRDKLFAKWGPRWDRWRQHNPHTLDLPLDISDDGEEIRDLRKGPWQITKLWKDNYLIRFHGEEFCIEWRVLPSDTKRAQDRALKEVLKENKDQSWFLFVSIPILCFVEAVETRLLDEETGRWLTAYAQTTAKEWAEREALRIAWPVEPISFETTRDNFNIRSKMLGMTIT